MNINSTTNTRAGRRDIRAKRLGVRRDGAAFSWFVAHLLVAMPLLTGCGADSGALLLATPNAVDFGNSKLNESIQVAAPQRGARLAIRASCDAKWLKLSPEEFFSAGPTDATSVVLSISRASMKPGRNTCFVRFTSGGHEDTLVHVAADAIVSADFRVSNADSRPGELVLFNDATRVLTGAQPVTAWKWDFGDGATSAERNPVHAYEHEGAYSVSLTVTSGSGTDVRLRENCVTVKQPAVPSADFVSSPRRPVAGVDVQFRDLSTSTDSEVVAWTWDFGDGTTSTEQHPTHLYSLAAVYDVYLTVRNKYGADTALRLGYVDVQPAREP